MIDFEHVSKNIKKFSRLALEDINFHVDEGEFVFLLGHTALVLRSSCHVLSSRDQDLSSTVDA